MMEQPVGRSTRGKAAIANLWIAAAIVLLAAIMPLASGQNNENEPQPPRAVDSGWPYRPPADAVILFDGKNLDKWRHADGRPAEWSVTGGAMTVRPRTGGIVSLSTFADAQVHVEFATPVSDSDEGQGRGNSGVYLQGRYEVQVLDSYENDTYPDGQCGAIYGQHIPLVNACHKSGQWQAYDIIFHPPHFDDQGQKVKPGTITVFHNGVLIQDHVELKGSTTAAMQGEGPGDGPLYLQDHGDLVQYRNIWVRCLPQAG